MLPVPALRALAGAQLEGNGTAGIRAGDSALLCRTVPARPVYGSRVCDGKDSALMVLDLHIIKDWAVSLTALRSITLYALSCRAFRP